MAGKTVQVIPATVRRNLAEHLEVGAVHLPGWILLAEKFCYRPQTISFLNYHVSGIPCQTKTESVLQDLSGRQVTQEQLLAALDEINPAAFEVMKSYIAETENSRHKRSHRLPSQNRHIQCNQKWTKQENPEVRRGTPTSNWTQHNNIKPVNRVTPSRPFPVMNRRCSLPVDRCGHYHINTIRDDASVNRSVNRSGPTPVASTVDELRVNPCGPLNEDPNGGASSPDQYVPLLVEHMHGDSPVSRCSPLHSHSINREPASNQCGSLQGEFMDGGSSVNICGRVHVGAMPGHTPLNRCGTENVDAMRGDTPVNRCGRVHADLMSVNTPVNRCGTVHVDATRGDTSVNRCGSVNSCGPRYVHPMLNEVNRCGQLQADPLHGGCSVNRCDQINVDPGRGHSSINRCCHLPVGPMRYESSVNRCCPSSALPVCSVSSANRCLHFHSQHLQREPVTGCMRFQCKNMSVNPSSNTYYTAYENFVPEPECAMPVTGSGRCRSSSHSSSSSVTRPKTIFLHSYDDTDDKENCSTCSCSSEITDCTYL